MNLNCLGRKVLFLVGLMFVFLSFAYSVQAQSRGAFIVENYYENDVLKKDFAEYNGIELSITSSLQDDFYYFTNEWVVVTSYSTGPTWDWEEVDKDVALDFDIDNVDENVKAYRFKWKYSNSYDRDKGEATVLFIEHMIECEVHFICVVTIKSKDLVLRYDGYRE